MRSAAIKNIAGIDLNGLLMDRSMALIVDR